MTRRSLYFLTLGIYFALSDPGTHTMWQEFLSIIPEAHAYFYTRPVVVVLCWLGAFFGTGALLIHQNPMIRRTVWVLFWITTSLNWISHDVTQSPFNVHQYELVLSEMTSAPDFISANLSFLLTAAAKIVGLNLLLWFAIKGIRPHPTRRLSLWVILLFLGTGINTVRYKAVTPGTPPLLAVPASVVYKHVSKRYYGPRDTLETLPHHIAKANTIILIVDETVRDDFLTINNPDIDTTPYLTTLPLINYGTAMAIANSSRHSNTGMRAGLMPKQIPDKSFNAFKQPNLFQFAKNAGFKTYYANGQKLGTTFDNLMNKYDLPYIDVFENLGPGYDSAICGDEPVANFIIQHTSKTQKNFIYVNKMGNHFPYAKQYPTSQTVYSPAHKPGETQSDYTKTVNAYKNAVRWTVNQFFAYLLPKLAGQDYLIIYVSDHGEAIEEANRASGHASVLHATPDEVRVALFALTTQPVIEQALQKALPQKINKATQFDIFPTLLWAMGYDHQWIREHIGISLLDTDAHPQQFFVGSIQHSGHWEDFKVALKNDSKTSKCS